MKELIEYDVFDDISKKLEIRLGSIQEVDRVPKTDNLLKLSVFFGDAIGTKTVISNAGGEIDNIIDLYFTTFPFIMNIKPRKVYGILSECVMLLPRVDDKINLNGIPGSSII